ncbi:PspC domain-containing protein [Actinomyces viscosus]|uniref:Phage shock protein C n=1 Tax=Actinomyces viscosus TaxID=1656 RepID=A0A3S4Z6Q0_ACTVI|nr:PspC domain-containing protein [Actinomyces viscosus]TFH53686.1 PspC domain-containing protein [Actinomyces viscosus]VEI14268.1 phage shock protein C [Actinomyces viscosus]
MNDTPTPPSDGSSAADSSFPGFPGSASSNGTAGPQPGPAPSHQQYGSPRPDPEGGATHRFFDSLRGSGLMRANDRWIAGVAGGVAYRFGLDPILVRCVWVVLSIFSGVGLVLYGVAWALLPEESDGRIHLEEALAGRFNAGLAGAIGTTIVGMSTIDNGFIPGWYVNLWGIPGIAAPVWSLFWLGLTILAVIFAVRFVQNRRSSRSAPQGPQSPQSPQGPQPWQTTWNSSTAQAPGTQPRDQSGQAGTAPAAGPSAASDSSRAPGSGASAFSRPPSGPAWQNRSYRQYQPYQSAPVPVRPPRPRRPGPGSSISLAVLGLGLLTGAGIWYGTATHRIGLLQGQFVLIGTLVALLGAGILLSGLRRRSGGWMTVLGWPVLFVMAIPALVIASVTPTSLTRMPFGTITNASTYDSSTVTWKELTSSASNGGVTYSKDVGNLTLDLRGVPADEVGRISTINAHLDVGRLIIRTDGNQRVTVKTDVDMGGVESRVSRAWSIDGRQMEKDDESPTTYDVNGATVPTYRSSRGGLNVTSTLTSPSPSSDEDGRPTITVNASVDTGTIEVEERSGAVSWYGNAEEPVWIVSFWYDEKGEAHYGTLPVPGMSHQAVTADDAEACIRTAHESEDKDNRSEGVTWRNLSELTSKERGSYDACVQKALSRQPAAQPSASPSGTATPAPSPAPAEQQPPADAPADAG